MKHKTPDSMKFKRLMRALGESRRGVAGLLELLWIATQNNAKRGDIGQYTNEEIAIECDYDGDPDKLVSALVETGWLDACEKNRLVIHDWQQHAPRYIYAWIKSQNTTFATVETTVGATVETTVGTTVETTVDPIRNVTKRNVTKEEHAAKTPRPYPDEFEDWWSIYPPNASGRKRGKAASHTVWKTIAGDDRQILLEATRHYAAENQEFIRDPERFLKRDWWRDWVGQPEKTNQASSRVPTSADLENYNPHGTPEGSR